jgi:pyruvate dehydrogenase E1 component
MPWALEAQERLRREWSIDVDVWSVTSWTQLRRDALAAEEWNRLHPEGPRREAHVTSRLRAAPGPVVAVSDWMRAVPDQIAPFVPGAWSSLGTDGFGLSDTRQALRRHFRVDAASIVLRVLEQLVHAGALDSSVLDRALSATRRSRDEGSE